MTYCKHMRNLWTALALALAVCVSFAPLSAQPTEVTLSLLDSRVEIDRLARGLTSGEAVFLIDDANRIEIDVATSAAGVTSSILAPTGEVIDETTITGLGGEVLVYEGQTGGAGPVLSLATQPGFHTTYSFPSLGSGTYRVRFETDPGLSEEVAVITQLLTDSPVGVALLATESAVVPGSGAVLVAAVFDSGQPVTGATVDLTLVLPGGGTTTADLVDDGLDADDASGDGLYTVELDLGTPGEYTAVARIAGTTSSGAAFERQASAGFTVLPTRTLLTGSVSDQGVDDDGDGLLDRVVLTAGTDTQQAGEYRLFATLAASGGQTLVRSAAATLPTGPGSVPIDFEAAGLFTLGEDGPWEITALELVFLGSQAAVPSHRLLDLGQTQAYLLSQLQRPDLVLTGIVTDQAFDDDGNGLFDRLVVDLEVDVLRAGFYSWSYKLTGDDGTEVDFSSASGFLAAGLNSLRLTFNGEAIGAAGVDGPYALRDLLLFGSGANLVATRVGSTQAYRASEFEGFVGDVTPPTLTVEVDPSLLWPPNHKLVEVTASITVVDDIDPAPVVQLIAILSDEEDNAIGDGNTTEDIQGAELGSDDRSFLLRAERSGLGDGREYTVVYEASDSAGNSTTASAVVTVPHEQ